MPKCLIVLGASVRAAAHSAIRAGFEPYAIDLYADRDLAASCTAVEIDRYPQDFLPALAAAPKAPWLYTGGLENHPRLIERLAAQRPLLGNRGPVLQAVRNLRQLAQAAVEVGLRIPATAATIPATDRPSSWLVKRRHSSGGLGVRFATETDRRGLSRGAYFQQYAEGEPASAVFVAAGGRAVLLGASRQLLAGNFNSELPFLYAGSIAPLILRDEETAKLRSLGGLLAERFALAGLFGVDFIRATDGLWILEVNPRYTASVEILERSSGQSFLSAHVAACESGAIQLEVPLLPAKIVGKRIVYAHENAMVGPKFDRLVAEWNGASAWPAIADLPRVGNPIRAGQPVVTVFAEGNSEPQVESKLQLLAAAIHDAIRPCR
jgi:predicted ATP-grasp superfamily ATP-dependent carboligase